MRRVMLVISYAQYDEADPERHERRAVRVAKGTNDIIDVDAAVATLLS
jgi:aspartate 1-decarboxylase